MIKFISGLGIGLFTGLMLSFYIPSSWIEKGLSAGSSVVEKVDEIKQEHCQAKFLEETQCFQKFSSTQCTSMIKSKCG